VTYDAARDTAAAESRARQELGRYATNVRFEWDLYSKPDVVRLRVVAKNPRFLGPAIDTFVGFDEIDRTVEVRVEQFR
jgi:hypothetical protein